MSYSKPQVIKRDSTLNAIQGAFKIGFFIDIIIIIIFNATVAAYEADE